MHETHLIENVLRFLEEQEKASSRKIRKIYVTVSEFGTINQEHFIEHYKKSSLGTKWESLGIEISKIPCGSEFEITKIDFSPLENHTV